MSKGGKVLGHDSLPKSTTSYAGELTKIAATHPDAIFFGGNDGVGRPFVSGQLPDQLQQ